MSHTKISSDRRIFYIFIHLFINALQQKVLKVCWIPGPTAMLSWTTITCSKDIEGVGGGGPQSKFT